MPHHERPRTIPGLADALDSLEFALKSGRNFRNRGILADSDLERIRGIRNQLLRLIDDLIAKGVSPPPMSGNYGSKTHPP